MRAVGEAGFTLIEVLIALVLFSLIGVAGFSLLNAIVGVQSRMDGRLERLSELQRAMHVITLDFQQVSGPSLATRKDGSVVIRRNARSGPRATLVVRYDLSDGVLRRSLSLGAGQQAQTLITGVDKVRWSFYDRGAWTAVWPPQQPGADQLPEAIAVDVTVRRIAGGLAGNLRRVVRLPALATP